MTTRRGRSIHSSMSFETYTITARCLIAAKTLTAETMSRLNNRLNDVMRHRGFKFENGDYRDLLLGQPMSTMRFSTALGFGNQPLVSRLRESHAKWHERTYFKLIRGLVDSLPYDLLFKIGFGTATDESTGFLIEIECQPAIVAKIRQLHAKDTDDPVHFDNIIYENTQAVGEIIHALGATVLREPSVLKLREWSRPVPIIDDSLIERLPEDVARCLREANSCYIAGSSHACSVMIREAVEVAATKKLRQEGQEARIYDLDGHEVGLGKKLDLLADVTHGLTRSLDEVKRMKWLGDVSAHDPRTEIRSSDLQNIGPLLRSFFASLELKH